MSISNGTLVIIGMAVLSLVSAANAKSYSCSHSSGDRIFKGSEKIQVFKNDTSIIVHPVVSGVRVSEHYWTYRVVAENGSASFRAIRLGETVGSLPSKIDLDMLFGGEIYLQFEGEKYKALAVAVNSGTGEVVSESLVCAIAT